MKFPVALFNKKKHVVVMNTHSFAVQLYEKFSLRTDITVSLLDVDDTKKVARDHIVLVPFNIVSSLETVTTRLNLNIRKHTLLFLPDAEHVMCPANTEHTNIKTLDINNCSDNVVNKKIAKLLDSMLT